jgi:hypothetical protein
MAVTTKKYRATRPLYYPSPVTLRKIRSGESVTFKARLEQRAKAGAVLSDLPPESIKTLLKKGWIEEVADEGEPDGN